MEQTAQNPTACRGAWRQVAVAMMYSAGTGLAWAIVRVTTDEGWVSAAAEGLQFFGFAFPAMWAASNGGCCSLLRRTAERSPVDKAWHER